MKAFLKKTLLAALALCLLGGAGPWRAYAADSTSGNPETPVYPELDPGETALPVSNLVITGYRVLNSLGRPVSAITRGTTVTIVVTLKNSGIATDQAIPGSGEAGTAANLDVFRSLDSFTGGEGPAVEILSGGQAPLELQVTFPGLTYSGIGQELHFMVGYWNIAIPYDTQSLSIPECREYVDEPSTPPPAAPEPMFLISRADRVGTVSSGGGSTLALKIENIGATAISSGVVYVTPSAGLILMDNSFSHGVGFLAPGQSAFLYVKVKASEEIDAAAQSPGLQFSYSYPSAGAAAQGFTSTQVPVLAEVRPTVQPTEPILQIGRDGGLDAVEAGQEFPVTLWIRNLGETTAMSPIVSIAPGSGLMLMDNAASQVLPDLAPGGYGSITIRLKALPPITSPAQELNVDVKFRYSTGKSSAQGTTSDKIIIPAKPTSEEETPEPVFQFRQEGVLNPVPAGQNFSVTVWVKNLGEVAAQSPILTCSPSSGLMLMEGTASQVLNNLEPGQAAKIQIKLKALGDLTSPAQELGLELKYRYHNGKAATQGTASDKLVIPTRPNPSPSEAAPLAAATPNVIVQQYSYGDSQVTAGAPFPLGLTFVNTSQTKVVENITMSLETDEGLSITSSSNTFYFPALAPGESVTQSLDVMAVNSEKTASPSIGITFKYEYVDQGTRHSVTSSEKISIPVCQPIRLEVAPPAIPVDVTAGAEVVLTLPYVNKGRGTVYNVSAVLEGDVTALTSTQNIGNMEPGKSGSIDFILTPETAGDIRFTVRISYETASAEAFTMEIPVTLSVGEAYEEPPYEWDDPGMDEPEEPALPVLALAIPAAVSIVAAVVLVVVLKRKKRRAQPPAR